MCVRTTDQPNTSPARRMWLKTSKRKLPNMCGWGRCSQQKTSASSPTFIWKKATNKNMDTWWYLKMMNYGYSWKLYTSTTLNDYRQYKLLIYIIYKICEKQHDDRFGNLCIDCPLPKVPVAEMSIDAPGAMFWRNVRASFWLIWLPLPLWKPQVLGN